MRGLGGNPVQRLHGCVYARVPGSLPGRMSGRQPITSPGTLSWTQSRLVRWVCAALAVKAVVVVAGSALFLYGTAIVAVLVDVATVVVGIWASIQGAALGVT